MMKTKRIHFMLPVLIVLTITACDSYLDFQPQQEIDSDKVFKTEEGVKSALDGAWSILGNEDFFAGTSIFHSDLLGANSTTRIVWDGTFIGYRQMFQKALSKNDGTIASKWISAYRAINLCNNILANLSLIDDSEERKRVEGEAKFIRGVLYFELVRFYAQPYGVVNADYPAGDNTHPGVPLLTTPFNTYEEIIFPQRATVAEVYDRILKDLNDAKALLPKGKAGANRGLATSTNTSAFLARVYLSMKRWVDAANEATIVIDEFGGASALNVTPRAAYNNTNYTTEDVFMIRQNLQSHAGSANSGIGTFFASMPGFGRGDVRIQAAHINLFESTDLRGGIEDNPSAKVIGEITKMYYWGYGSRSGRRRTTKWGRFDAYINVIRLPEMYLTRAEANFMANTNIGAEPWVDLNVVRARAKASLLSGPSDVTLDVIKSDRYKELCFEGHSLHDLKRWQGFVVAPMGSPWASETIQWNDRRLVLPIPQREIETNKNLTQNPGY